ncbi:hypothetical protein [Hyphomicrobium sp. ghe19]|uniref:hypothetical protein n=1 Tax=Hyphomicrobium sp. ghe19 TaxID=2682968 RepID=UPI0013670B81|nr:hypothetical protein HYPP_02475 [Hyphomicrobium sp. ghe19]
MASKKIKRPHMARCLLLAEGSFPAAHILYRLMVWPPKVEHNGRKWIAKSYEELQWETGLSKKQVRTGIAAPIKLGFVDTERHMFAGRNVNHFLLTPKFWKAFEDAAVGDQEGTFEDAPEGTFGDAQEGT